MKIKKEKESKRGFERADRMLPDRKTGSDHRYQLSYRYPNVIQDVIHLCAPYPEPSSPLFRQRGGRHQVCSPNLPEAVVVAFYCKRSDSRLVKTTFLQIRGRDGIITLLNFPPQGNYQKPKEEANFGIEKFKYVFNSLILTRSRDS